MLPALVQADNNWHTANLAWNSRVEWPQNAMNLYEASVYLSGKTQQPFVVQPELANIKLSVSSGSEWITYRQSFAMIQSFVNSLDAEFAYENGVFIIRKVSKNTEVEASSVQYQPQIIHTYQLTHHSAAQTAFLLNQIYIEKFYYATNEFGQVIIELRPQITYVEHTNALIVKATQNQLLSIQAIVSSIDKNPQEMRTAWVVPLRYAVAADLSRILNQVLPGLQVHTDVFYYAPSNMLIVCGPQSIFFEVNRLIKELDGFEWKNKSGVMVYTSKSTPVMTLSELFQQIKNNGGKN